jgi:hypothetical protein
MHQSGKRSSLEAIEWLEYENSRFSYNGKIIHALNGGEKKVKGYFVDGYIEIQYENSQNSSPYTIGFEFMGCHVHVCPHNCRKSMQTEVQAVADQERLDIIRRELDELKLMFSCVWKQTKKNVEYTASLSCFLGKQKITDSNLIDAVSFGLTTKL